MRISTEVSRKTQAKADDVPRSIYDGAIQVVKDEQGVDYIVDPLDTEAVETLQRRFDAALQSRKKIEIDIKQVDHILASITLITSSLDYLMQGIEDKMNITGEGQHFIERAQRLNEEAHKQIKIVSRELIKAVTDE